MSNHASESHTNDIRVGTIELGSGNRDYWTQFSVRELAADWVATTKGKGVSKMKTRLPAHGEYVVPLAPEIAGQGFIGPKAESAWERTCGIASQLNARKLLLRTPGSFRPTPENEARLVEFFTPQRLDQLSLYWWAEGLWESQPELTGRICSATGMTTVIDPLALDSEEEAPMTPDFYWRIMGGRGMRRGLNDFELEQLVEDVLARKRGTVIFAGPSVVGDAKRFVRLLKMELELDASDDGE